MKVPANSRLSRRKAGLSGAIALLLSSAALGSDKEEILVNRNTTLNLIEGLVKRGVLDRKSADEMIREAREQAIRDAKAELEREAKAKAAEAPAPAGAAPPEPAGAQHVTYVPAIVKDEIRREVRKDLREEVVRDVKSQAKAEQWGVPAALPDWVNRIKPYFDARLRLTDEFYASGNAPYYDWQAINREGGISQALARDNAYLNTSVDRLRLTERFRVGFDAKITDSLTGGFRLTTTNFYSPVSTNQTLGNYNQSWIVAIDRAFLQYDYRDGQGNDWLTLWGGRIPNPFLSTEMMYSAMLSFEGLAGTFRWRFNQDDPVVAAYHAHSPTGRYGVNLGPQTPDSLYASFGILPLEDVNFSSQDKWLFAAQAGADWLVHGESRLKFGAAYYGYRNVRARRNAFDSLAYDWTAPEFMQKGNSLAAINDARNQTACNTGARGAQNICLVGLASDFQVMDLVAAYDYAGFAPIHVLLTADYAVNFGFDSDYIYNNFGQRIAPHTQAYMVRLDVGRPELRRFGDWNVFFAYRRVERDAVLDAFTDPIFHQGGTDAKGWVLSAQYAVASNTWLDLRWLSSDAVNDPPLSIDTLNLDLNARF